MMVKKIKILYFITGLGKGGAENQLYNLMTMLSKDKFLDIKILTLFDGPNRKKIENLGIKVKVFQGKVFVFSIIKVMKFLIKNIKEFKPNIVHSFLFHTNIISKLSLFFIKKGSVKLICSYRSVIKKLPLIKYLEYINMAKVDMLISNSNTANNDLEIYDKYNIERKVICNSFDDKKIDKAQVKKLKKQFENKKIILTIANFRKEKDFTTNVLCCKELSKKRKDFLFLYVGSDGPELEVVNKLSKKYSLQKFIKILGRRDDILELLKICDVFFMPTLFESQSNSIMEAIYMKKPIVSTKIPANYELIKKGFLCNLRDYKTMTKKINFILDGENNNEWEKINFNYLKKKFSKEKIANKYRKVYKRLVFSNYYEKK